MQRNSRARISLWVTPLFLIIYLTAAINPIYGDEVAYEYILGRYFREDGHNLFMFPICVGSFSREVSWLWRIPRMLLAIVYEALPNLLALRAAGVLIALVNSHLLVSIFFRAAPRASPNTIGLFTLSMAVGCLPFLTVMARPEGLLVMLALLAIRICQGGIQRGTAPHSRGRALVAPLAITMCALFAQAIHPLGVLETPIFLGALWLLRLRNKMYIALALTIVTSGVVNATSHAATYRCPEMLAASDYLQNYGARTSAAGVLNLITALPESLLAFVGLIFFIAPGKGSVLGMWPETTWLPQALTIGIGAGLMAAWVAIFYRLTAKVLIESLSPIQNHLLERDFARTVSISILATLAAVIFFQPSPLPYRLVFILPLLMLAVGVLALQNSEGAPSHFYASQIYRMASLSGATVLLCGVAYVPVIARDNYLPRPNGWLFNANQFREVAKKDIEDALRGCELASTNSQRRLVVDYNTYWEMRWTREPIFANFMTSNPTPPSWDEVKNIHASGVLMTCSNARLRFGKAPYHEFGDICCLSKDDISSLAAGTQTRTDS